MSWQQYVDVLTSGSEVSFRPRGNSMKPRIKSGQLVTLSPNLESLAVGDVVLCRVKGGFLVHLLSAVDGERYQISNNSGRINGWIKKNKIYGRVVKIEA